MSIGVYLFKLDKRPHPSPREYFDSLTAERNFTLPPCRLMQASIDTTEVDRGPIVDNNVQILLFYIFFVVVFSFFFLNIFVALIILTFQEQGEKDQGECELDRNQVSC